MYMYYYYFLLTVHRLARIQEPRLDCVPPVMSWPWVVPSVAQMYQMQGMFPPYVMLPPYPSPYTEYPSPQDEVRSTPSPVSSEEALSPPAKIRKYDNEVRNSRPGPSHQEAKTAPAMLTKVSEVHEDKPAVNAGAATPSLDTQRQQNSAGLDRVTSVPRQTSRRSADPESSTERDYECGQCRMRTRSHHGLKRHLNSHGDALPTRPAVCARCRQQFLNVFDLYFHVLSHYKGDDNNNGDSEKTQDVPQATVKDDDHFPCDKAAKKSLPRLFECGECRLRVRSYCGLRRHFKKHPSLGPLPAVCGVCKTAFPNTVQLHEHMLGHYGVVPKVVNGQLKRLACQFCSETFVSADVFSRHLLSHERGAALPSPTK